MVSLVYQLPSHPERRDEIVDEFEREASAFLLHQTAFAGGDEERHDALLRRTRTKLSDEERTRSFHASSEAEANELLDRTRVATLAAAQAMPDPLKQLIQANRSLWKYHNWIRKTISPLR